MAFTIPDEAEAAFPVQARLYQSDIDALVAGQGGTGVVSGCAVTAQGSPDMTLAVAAGEILSAGTAATVTSGNVTVTAAHGSLDRLDLVVVSSTGTKSVEAGTAAATASVLPPPCPAGSVVLAQVYVPATDTAIGSTQIVDKRVVVSGGATSPVVQAAGTWHVSPYVGAPGSGTLVLLNRVHACPCSAPTAFSLTDVAVTINVAGNTGNVIRLGVFDSLPSGLPGTVLGQGTVVSDTTGHKVLNFGSPLTIPAGLFWILAVEQGSGTLATIYMAGGEGYRMLPSDLTGSTPPLDNNRVTRTYWYLDGVSGTYSSNPALSGDAGADRIPYLAYKVA